VRRARVPRALVVLETKGRASAVVLGELATLHACAGRLDEARRCFESSEPVLRELGPMLCRSGELGEMVGDLSGARACRGQAVALKETPDAGPESTIAVRQADLRRLCAAAEAGGAGALAASRGAPVC
jgi:hypothetical protein